MFGDVTRVKKCNKLKLSNLHYKCSYKLFLKLKKTAVLQVGILDE